MLQEPIPVTQLVRETATVMQEFTQSGYVLYLVYITKSIWLRPPVCSTVLKRVTYSLRYRNFRAFLFALLTLALKLIWHEKMLLKQICIHKLGY